MCLRYGLNLLGVWEQGARLQREQVRRRLRDEELHNVASPKIIKVVKSRRTTWFRHAASMGEIRNAYRVLGREDTMRKTYT
jgi:hypothetical protein